MQDLMDQFIKISIKIECSFLEFNFQGGAIKTPNGYVELCSLA